LLYADASALKLLEARDVEVVGRELSDLFAPSDRSWVHRSVESADGSGWHPVTLSSGGQPKIEVSLDAEDPRTGRRQVWFRDPSEGSGATETHETTENPEQMHLRKDPGKHVTVLICDDEARLAALTAGLLEEYGFDPITAAVGDEALGIVTRASPPVDVLLLDVNLTVGLSAQALLSALEGRRDAPKVILTSGLAEEDVPDDLRRHVRVAGYLAKPYSVEQLVFAIDNALSGGPAAR
jgi:CheY-like chemotaxis protein